MNNLSQSLLIMKYSCNSKLLKRSTCIQLHNRINEDYYVVEGSCNNKYFEDIISINFRIK